MFFRTALGPLEADIAFMIWYDSGIVSKFRTSSPVGGTQVGMDTESLSWVVDCMEPELEKGFN